jgi:hypothetical protein
MKSRVNVVIVAALLGLASMVRGETAYFLMANPPSAARDGTLLQAYVVQVTDAPKIAQARAYLSAGASPVYLIPHVRIAAGADAVNRNYAQPGQPAWDWHVVELINWTNYDTRGAHTAEYILKAHGAPADALRILAGEGQVSVIDPVTFVATPVGPTDEMSLVYYPLMMELKPAQAGNVLNVSTRGYVGTGERVLITGFVVGSGAPRNVLVRGLGPSLGALGVGEPLADPVIDVYHGSERIATNDDWKAGNLAQSNSGQAGAVRPEYAAFAPLNDKESAMRLMLPPGNYTVIVRGATSGIALAEVYDLDALQTR